MRKNWIFFFIGAIVVLSCTNASEIKRDQYFAEGAKLFNENCANCHQVDGSGMADLYPPMTGSGQKDAFFCMVKNGISGPILVNSKTYNRPMPANPKLTEIEIAEIATYVYNRWGKEKEIVTIDSVKKALGNCPPVASSF